MNHALFETLRERGYVYQCTDLQAVKSLLESDQKITFYLGIDPTADSLHIGHFFALMMFRYLQDAGHHGIVVIGGATAMIGDPSGKCDMRKMLSREQVQHNLEEVRQLVRRFVRTEGENPALILNNADWMDQYSYVDFMRLVGVHFNVNTMLSAETYSNRLKQGGLTFLEMGYMLMQAYDFVHIDQQLMAHTEGCCVANANLFSSGIQRRQRKRVFQHNNPRFHGLVGVGGQLLGVVGELPAAGFALEALLPTQNPLANENGILVAAARTGIRLNLGQLLIQRQKALDRLADLIFLVFAELFQNRL